MLKSKRSSRKAMLGGGLLALCAGLTLAGCTSPATVEEPKLKTSHTSTESQTETAGYKADLQELAERIKSEHPRPFRYISEPDFDRLVASSVESMGPESSRADALWAFSEILASIQCGHTGMSYFNQENALIEVEDRFPVDVRFVGERLVVLDPLANSDRLEKGDEIASINGQSVNELRTKIFPHIAAEGVAETFKDYAFNYYATAYLTYALGFPDAYQLTLVGQTAPTELKPLTDFSSKPVINPAALCQEGLCSREDIETGAGIMTIRSFAYYGDQGQVFADFVDSALADVVEKDRPALIIDIRGNNGGSGLAVAYVLRRLTEEPFVYWSDQADKRGVLELFDTQRPVDVGLDAPVFLLVDGNTVSTAPHFAALFKEHGMGTIVGEAMGGNASTNDGAQNFSSTVHGIEYSIARMRFDVAAPSLSLDEAVQPDFRYPTPLMMSCTATIR
ncbi:S41 family peptidase [Henriciella litoralis]|uniref:S41 family peptidase n=1 Tax=Henriciella litoralis TaxID=568102 RepID=UPI001469F75D|nr:S41 family peptidase [Henriciella litoralis]